MSTKLSLKEALDLRENTEEKSPPPSDFPTLKATLRADEISDPVELVHFLRTYGLSFRRAYDTLNRLVAGGAVTVELCTNDKPSLLEAKLAKRGVRAGIIQRPEIDVKSVRERRGVTQKEFADQYGFSLDTLQNWEQGRNAPDNPVLLLLKLIDSYPLLVEMALTARTSSFAAKFAEAPAVYACSISKISNLMPRTKLVLFAAPTATWITPGTAATGLTTALSSVSSPFADFVWIARPKVKAKEASPSTESET